MYHETDSVRNKILIELRNFHFGSLDFEVGEHTSFLSDCKQKNVSVWAKFGFSSDLFCHFYGVDIA